MEYRALALGLTDELFSGIQAILASSSLRLTPSLTVRDAAYLLEQQIFHLLIVDLEYLRSIGKMDWLAGIRRITFIPVIVLCDAPEQDTHSMVQLGADICVSGKQAHSIVADLSLLLWDWLRDVSPLWAIISAQNDQIEPSNFLLIC